MNNMSDYSLAQFSSMSISELETEIAQRKQAYDDPYWTWENSARVHEDYWAVIRSLETELEKRKDIT